MKMSFSETGWRMNVLTEAPRLDEGAEHGVTVIERGEADKVARFMRFDRADDRERRDDVDSVRLKEEVWLFVSGLDGRHVAADDGAPTLQDADMLAQLLDVLHPVAREDDCRPGVTKGEHFPLQNFDVHGIEPTERLV